MKSLKTNPQQVLMRKFFSFLTLAFFLAFDLLSFPSQTYAQNLAGLSVRAGTLPGNLLASDHSTKMQVSPELGFIDDSYQGSTDKKIIYIQDAHDSLEAQEKIAQLIEYFVKQNVIQTVYEEAYEGPVPTDIYFGPLQDADVKEQVSYHLMDALRYGVVYCDGLFSAPPMLSGASEGDDSPMGPHTQEYELQQMLTSDEGWR